MSRINWKRNGGAWVGRTGKQVFHVMPDGLGRWILTAEDQDGIGHLLDCDIPTDWSAMAKALEYVYVSPWRAILPVLVLFAIWIALGVAYGFAL